VKVRAFDPFESDERILSHAGYVQEECFPGGLLEEKKKGGRKNVEHFSLQTAVSPRVTTAVTLSYSPHFLYFI